MKSKATIQKELIQKFGENFNIIENLMKWLKCHYHPTFFESIKDFSKTPYFNVANNVTISDYTDNYITENEAYVIVLFDDYRDFNNALPEDKFHDDVVISFDAKSKKILKYYYTRFENNYLHDIEAFIL